MSNAGRPNLIKTCMMQPLPPRPMVLLVTQDLDIWNIRKNIGLDIIWCLNKHIPKHMAEIVNAKGLGRGELSVGWCLQEGLVALGMSPEAQAGLGQAPKYVDGRLGRGGSGNPLRKDPISRVRLEELRNWRRHSPCFLGAGVSLKSISRLGVGVLSSKETRHCPVNRRRWWHTFWRGRNLSLEIILVVSSTPISWYGLSPTTRLPPGLLSTLFLSSCCLAHPRVISAAVCLPCSLSMNPGFHLALLTKPQFRAYMMPWALDLQSEDLWLKLALPHTGSVTSGRSLHASEPLLFLHLYMEIVMLYHLF